MILSFPKTGDKAANLMEWCLSQYLRNKRLEYFSSIGDWRLGKLCVGTMLRCPPLHFTILEEARDQTGDVYNMIECTWLKVRPSASFN